MACMGLDAVELVIAWEEAFDVRFSDEDAAAMRTPRDVIDFIAGRRRDLTREAIAARVREITFEQVGKVDYGEDKAFVADMGID